MAGREQKRCHPERSPNVVCRDEVEGGTKKTARCAVFDFVRPEKSSHPERSPDVVCRDEVEGGTKKLRSVQSSTSFAPTRNVGAHYAHTDNFGIGQLDRLIACLSKQTSVYWHIFFQ